MKNNIPYIKQYIKQFDDWNIEKKKINKREKFPEFVLSRELWWCQIGVNVGSEQDGKGENFERPVVIIKQLSDRTFLIVPTTSKNKDNKNHVKVTTLDGKFSYALVDQVRVIDIKRINRKIGTISVASFDMIIGVMGEYINCESSLAGAFSEAEAVCNDIITSTKNKSQDSKLILGIDPGYDRVGIAVLDIEKGKDKLIFSTCIETERKLEGKKLEDSKRVAHIAHELESVIEKYKPTCVGVESLFLFKNQKTVIQVAEARGVIKYICEKNNLKIIELTPMQVKSSIAGDGHADKKQVEYMVRNILKLGEEGKIIDDEIDAIAIALTARLYVKSNI